MTQSTHTLLVELRTEEIPARMIKPFSEQFAQLTFNSLKSHDLTTESSEIKIYGTPRRLAFQITNVYNRQENKPVNRKGPSIGSNISAVEGFARSCGVSLNDLIQKDGYYFYDSIRQGESIDNFLSHILLEVLKKLPAPKNMRWGDNSTQFIRPVHGLIMLLDDQIIQGDVLGLKSKNETLGHRFMSKAEKLEISHADDYENILETVGNVIPSFEKRRKIIFEQLNQSAQMVSALPIEADNLLEEVTGLVEYPVVLLGEFSPEFLEVPQECLILSMRQHQKYFPLLDKNGKLLPKFLVVSNLKSPRPDLVTHGNERVLRARLSDARFFYQQDKKLKLGDRIKLLGDVVYHNKLGTQLDRIERIKNIAVKIAEKLTVSTSLVERASYLAKTDLLTDMVGEFPELQGVMGRYYALNDGEAPEVANAIQYHYAPRFASDPVPTELVSVCVSLADKLEALVGLYGVGFIPTSDKDPFGLRRHGLGITRIISDLNLDLDLVDLIDLAVSVFPKGMLTQLELDNNFSKTIYQFALERFKAYVRDQQNCGIDEIEAVLALDSRKINLVKARLDAIKRFKASPDAEALASANKRIRNILRKSDFNENDDKPINIMILTEKAEQDLSSAISNMSDDLKKLVDNNQYEMALNRVIRLRPMIVEFFDKVMVNDEREEFRINRLKLLNKLLDVMNQVGDISKLVV